jgi:hypothetical protein
MTTTQVMENLKVRNDTLRFILPALNFYGLTDKDILIEGLQGVYIKTLINPELDNNLLIKYRPSKAIEYAKIDSSMTLLESFRGDFDVDESIVYIIDLNPMFTKELNLILEGRYSELSDNYKQLIANFWGLKEDKEDPLSSVLWKTEAGEQLFNQFPENIQKLSASNEFWPRPVMEDESL